MGPMLLNCQSSRISASHNELVHGECRFALSAYVTNGRPHLRCSISLILTVPPTSVAACMVDRVHHEGAEMGPVHPQKGRLQTDER